jgi:hypothetical protein
MSSVARVTITLPSDVVADIDRMEHNRSRFVLQAVKHEIDHRRRGALRRSLDNPHVESHGLSDEDFEQWAKNLPGDDAATLVDANGGKQVRFVSGTGWIEAEK